MAVTVFYSHPKTNGANIGFLARKFDFWRECVAVEHPAQLLVVAVLARSTQGWCENGGKNMAGTFCASYRRQTHHKKLRTARALATNFRVATASVETNRS